MKNILVPTDFSECANNALDVAVTIAKKSGAQVHLLHVMPDYKGSAIPDPATSGGANASPSEEAFMVLLMNKNREQLEQLDAKYPQVDFKTNIVVGDVYDCVKDETKDKNIDLIILGSEGVSGVDEILIGSNAERVVRKSEVPVLVIKHKTTDFNIKNIVFATNCEDNTADLVFTLKRFQEFFGAKLHILNVNTPLNFFTSRSLNKMMNEYVEKHEIENCTTNVYNERTEEDGIIYFAEEVDADLIAMGTHGRSGLAHFFSGSIAEDVVNHSTRPIMTLKMEK